VLFFKIVLLQLPFLLLINFSQNLLKWTFTRARFLTMSLGFTVVHAIILIIAVLVFDVGIAGVLFVSLSTIVVFGALGLFFVSKWLARPKDFQCFRKMLPFAIPYGILSVVGALSPTLERTLTDALLGTESLGHYTVATKIAMLIGLLTSAFHSAWGPFSLSLYKQTDAKHTFDWVFKLFAFGVSLAVLILALLVQPLILTLATERYLGAMIVVFPLAMGLAIQATSSITEIGIGFSKRSHLSLYAYAIAIVVTLSGILLLTPIFGLYGVGLGVLLGHIVKAVVASWLAQKAYPLPWHYTPVVMIMSVTLISGLIATWLGQLYGNAANNWSLVVGLFTVMVLGWTHLLNQSERKRFLYALKRHF
jgi:O-antigen/teichoic acid export membrane protein